MSYYIAKVKFETVDDNESDSVNLDEDFSPDQQARLDQLQHEQAQ